MTRVVAALWLGMLSTAFLASGPAEGYAVEGPVWANGTTSFAYQVPGNNGVWTSAMQEALADWNAVTPFTFVPVNQSADPCDLTAVNGAAFGSTACDEAFGSSTLAITLYNYTNGQFTHAGTVFNSADTFSVYHGNENYSSEDFRRIAVHELGHVLGLAHETNTAIPAIMQAIIGNTELPTSDDIAGVNSLYGSYTKAESTIPLVSAVLPGSRSVQTSATATAFATIINAGNQTASSCSIALSGQSSASLSYQTTNAANAATGQLNQPVDIPAGAAQSFVISVTSSAAMSPANLGFNMACANAAAAPITTGLNTLLFAASTAPTPDVVTLTVTASNDGYVHLSSGSGAFAVATVNVGVSGTVIGSTDTGSASLPVTLNLCQTNPRTGACISAVGPTVTVTIGPNETPTFAVFVSGQGTIAPDPANKRIFIRFKDQATGATRGSSSVAVTTN
jgi:hypothetical protein